VTEIATDRTMGSPVEVAVEWTKRLAPVGVLLALLAMVGLFEPSFLGPRSLLTLIDESSALLLLALAQMVVVLTGRINLSIATLASLSTVLFALWLPTLGWLALPAVLVVAALAGLAQGWIHVRSQIPSFVVTLGALGVFAGIGLTASNAQTVGIPGGFDAVAWAFGDVLGLPRSFLIALLVLVVLGLALRYTPFGRWTTAIGYSEPAAHLAGVPVGRTVLGVFAVSGLCSGIAALLLVARSYSAGPSLADSLLLPALSAVVVGGTAITGGFGGVGRTLLGALIITVLRVGLGIMGVDPAFAQIVYGAVLAVAVALTIDRSKLPFIK
jgi:ribose transport system permease protein